ncbi:uncharacterized protein LOC113666043 [Pocillopora damicornis]|uniref:uncharacterized protein LOC113666043 n=1 Tax=Pocillopora damicornis TaxID=46731 RepID=UPI000F54DBCC|nr:uncharacterized protein LOC113666043 [Pocillopora damicornis]
MAVISFVFILTFLLVFNVSENGRSLQPGALHRDKNLQIMYGNFKATLHKHLSATVIATILTKDEFLCSFKCITKNECFSYNLATYPDNGFYICELLDTDKYRARKELKVNSSFHHFSPVSLCESSPCQNDGTCIPDFEQNSHQCDCKAGFAGVHCEACKFDFEDGIMGWIKTGTAFDNQPTFGDNPTARNRGQPSNHQGDWWIGGSEDRPTIGTPAGQVQGDGPQGTLVTPSFIIIGHLISFLIGGGCDINVVRAELIVDNQVVKQSTGRCIETLTQGTWHVQEFLGKRAFVKLIDISSGAWGHINFDDLKGNISCGQV